MNRPPVEAPKVIAKRLWKEDKEILKNIGPLQLEKYVDEACAGYTNRQRDRIYWALDSILRDNARPNI